jgi:hypothetical protein
MKKFISLTLLALVGCAQLQHGQEQPVIRKSAQEDIYFTTCAGAAEGWSDCYAKAHRTCSTGYTVLSKFDNNKGTQRDLTFKCK